ncbi:uncharacterized protein METZ01_LOCUS62787 [marine metagenome]|uniref:Uncharacterized protein n=1 Tax=marine metagenome TaxID=408172 RepID=A0A381T837_9ZZZZ
MQSRRHKLFQISTQKETSFNIGKRPTDDKHIQGPLNVTAASIDVLKPTQQVSKDVT